MICMRNKIKLQYFLCICLLCCFRFQIFHQFFNPSWKYYKLNKKLTSYSLRIKNYHKLNYFGQGIKMSQNIFFRLYYAVKCWLVRDVWKQVFTSWMRKTYFLICSIPFRSVRDVIGLWKHRRWIIKMSVSDTLN